MKLINKDAFIAEIKKWIELLTNEKNQEGASKIDKLSLGGRIAELQEVKAFLDTLEVKGVDLDYIKKELDDVVRIYKPNGDFGWGTLYNVATHFFELGLKAKGVEGICKISETNSPNFDEAQGTSFVKKGY